MMAIVPTEARLLRFSGRSAFVRVIGHFDCNGVSKNSEQLDSAVSRKAERGSGKRQLVGRCKSKMARRGSTGGGEAEQEERCSEAGGWGDIHIMYASSASC